MIVGFLLVLALTGPTGRIEAKTIQMPSQKLCDRAMKEWLKPPERIDDDAPMAWTNRSAACLTVTASGRDT